MSHRLRIDAFTSGLTAAIVPELRQAVIGSFSSFYGKGGVFEAAEVFVPRRDPRGAWAIRDKQRLTISDGLETVWEGEIAEIADIFEKGRRGNLLRCMGKWSTLMTAPEGRLLHKNWADNRFSEIIVTTEFEETKFQLDVTLSRLRVQPKDNVPYNIGDKINLGYYVMPTGQTIKRMTFDYDFREDPAWTPEGVRDNALADQANMHDDNTATSNTITFNAGQFFYVGSKTAFHGIFFDFGATVNANVATLTVEYHNGTAWGAVSGMSDGTSVAGKTWAQDGTVTFTLPNDWDPDSLVVSRMFWVRMSVSANLTASIVINEISVVDFQSWKLALFSNASASDEWSVTATGSGSVDLTLSVPSDFVVFYFDAQAGPQPGLDRKCFGEITNLIVYSETGAINLTEIAKDVRALNDGLSADESYIASNTQSITPFVTERVERHGDILNRAAGYGDASFNEWNCWLRPSSHAAVPDGKPVLVVEQSPPLTDFEYLVSRRDPNAIVPQLYRLGYSNNGAIVLYTAEYTDILLEITPADDANLKDATKVTADGERYVAYDIGTSTTTAATQFGRRLLTLLSKPQHYLSGPIVVRGSILTKFGSRVPVSRVRAGQRIKIIDYVDDEVGIIAGGKVFLMTRVTCTDEGREVQIETGNSDDLAVLLAQREIFKSRQVVS